MLVPAESSNCGRNHYPLSINLLLLSVLFEGTAETRSMTAMGSNAGQAVPAHRGVGTLGSCRCRLQHLQEAATLQTFSRRP